MYTGSYPYRGTKSVCFDQSTGMDSRREVLFYLVLWYYSRNDNNRQQDHKITKRYYHILSYFFLQSHCCCVTSVDCLLWNQRRKEDNFQYFSNSTLLNRLLVQFPLHDAMPLYQNSKTLLNMPCIASNLFLRVTKSAMEFGFSMRTDRGR